MPSERNAGQDIEQFTDVQFLIARRSFAPLTFARSRAAQAARPPYWERVKESEAIMNDPAIAHAPEPNMIGRT